MELVMVVPFEEEQKSATISPCGRYRYDLTRRWDDGRTVAFVGLNPSTADAWKDDPTIRRCRNFAKRWGFGGMVMLNLFAYRATKPQDMMTATDPIGPDNDMTLVRWAGLCDLVIACWGTGGGFRDRDRAALPLMSVCADNVWHIGLTSGGFPRHPLYVPGDTEPERYHGRSDGAR